MTTEITDFYPVHRNVRRQFGNNVVIQSKGYFNVAVKKCKLVHGLNCFLFEVIGKPVRIVAKY
jgi:hypothetical protein